MKAIFLPVLIMAVNLAVFTQEMPVPKVAPNDTAIVPATREPGDWYLRHEGLAANVKYNQKIVLVGDSQIHWWERSGIWAYTALLKKYNKQITNLGIGGDSTQHVIWRLKHGEFPEGINPAYVVVCVGSNNRQIAPESTAAGIGKIIEIIHGVSPSSKIILESIFPQGGSNAGIYNPVYKAVNDIIKNYDGFMNVNYLDLYSDYLDSEGRIKAEMFGDDKLHLSQKGYLFRKDRIIELIDKLESQKQ
jgi:lysophospholipase L1-like esterase